MAASLAKAENQRKRCTLGADGTYSLCNGNPERVEPERAVCSSVDAANHPGGSQGLVGGNADGQPRCLVTESHGTGIVESVLPADEAYHLDPNDVDCHIDEVHGPIQIKTGQGPPLKYEGQIPGLGSNGRALLDEIMRAPGQMLTTWHLSKNPQLSRIVEPWPRAAATMRLRRALGDAVGQNRFVFVASRPWRIRWQRERTWRIIERLAD